MSRTHIRLCGLLPYVTAIACGTGSHDPGEPEQPTRMLRARSERIDATLHPATLHQVTVEDLGAPYEYQFIELGEYEASLRLEDLLEPSWHEAVHGVGRGSGTHLVGRTMLRGREHYFLVNAQPAGPHFVGLVGSIDEVERLVLQPGISGWAGFDVDEDPNSPNSPDVVIDVDVELPTNHGDIKEVWAWLITRPDTSVSRPTPADHSIPGAFVARAAPSGDVIRFVCNRDPSRFDEARPAERYAWLYFIVRVGANSYYDYLSDADLNTAEYEPLPIDPGGPPTHCFFETRRATASRPPN